MQSELRPNFVLYPHASDEERQELIARHRRMVVELDREYEEATQEVERLTRLLYGVRGSEAG